jgi:hypothetical protein
VRHPVLLLLNLSLNLVHQSTLSAIDGGFVCAHPDIFRVAADWFTERLPRGLLVGFFGLPLDLFEYAAHHI